MFLQSINSGVALKLAKFGTANLQNGDELIIINNDGADAVFGTFADMPEGTNLGSNFLGTGHTAHITYVGGDGNDVALLISPGSLFPWHNFGTLTNDVVGSGTPQPDGSVAANDVLAIINYINANGSGPIPDNAVNGLPFGFLDTEADNQIVAADVVKVINYINAGRPNGGEAPAESSIWEDEAPTAPSSASHDSPLSSDLLFLLAVDLASLPVFRRRN
jgi:hypothetical protein